MDIYRKELERVYLRQNLSVVNLPAEEPVRVTEKIEALAGMSGTCCVVTNIANDSCYVVPALTGRAFGLSLGELSSRWLDSSDEDFLYARIHPEDLVDLRMLEYEIFSFVDTLPSNDKVRYKGVADVRMKGADGGWIYVSKGTQVVSLAPNGKMWLILCTYDITGIQDATNPRIIDISTGEIHRLSFDNQKDRLLTNREKELLRLIRQGKLSKEIASILGISINTVNRHRQNILGKLSVSNSMEAVNAAIAMRLL